MAEAPRHPEKDRSPAEDQDQTPTETATHGMERAPSLSEDIRAHTNQPHKGDVGRPETNEEVFQGSKTKELP